MRSKCKVKEATWPYERLTVNPSMTPEKGTSECTQSFIQSKTRFNHALSLAFVHNRTRSIGRPRLYVQICLVPDMALKMNPLDTYSYNRCRHLTLP